ncbi:hypothetical protein OAT18_00125 [Tenacibaculum sp.]|nr:hypothetical protein [Tenacibaculum sp.]
MTNKRNTGTASFDSGKGNTLKIKFLKPKQNKCYCNRDITEEEFIDIIKKIRKKDDVKQVHQTVANLKKDGQNVASSYNGIENITKVYKNKKGVLLARWGNDGYYTILNKKEFVQKDKPDKVYLEKSKFTELGIKIFNSKRKEKIKESEANIKNFIDHLNCTFTTYDITTCIRKIHFLAQSYHETGGFVDTYEKLDDGRGKSYEGGADFRGRGIKQITHDNNYLACYSELEGNDYYKNLYKGKNKIGEGVTEYIKRVPKHGFSKDIIKDLKAFSKKIATDLQYACYSAGYFWKFKDIYSYADNDDVIGLTKKINGFENGLDERKKYTKYFKEVFNYEKCIKK